MNKKKEPMIIAIARTRVEWFKLWRQIGIMLASSAQEKLLEEAKVIREWERESQPY